MTSSPVGATAATVVFTPGGGIPHAVLYGQGTNTVWLGGSAVSTSTGVPLAPGNRIIVPLARNPVYAVAGFSALALAGTVVTAPSVQGGTVLTGGGTAFTTGLPIVVEAATPRQEVATVLASNAGSVITAGPLTYSHPVGAVFTQISPQLATVNVIAGAS